MSTTPPSGGALRAALAHKGFPRFLTATAISTIGDSLNSVALLVAIYRTTGSAAWLGASVTLRIGAFAVASAAGGVIGDRYDRRTVLVALNIAAGIVTLGLTLGAQLNAGILLLIGLAALLDVAAGLTTPSFSASVPSVVGEEDVASANAAVISVEQIGAIAGPALGAVLVAAFSPELAFLCNAVSFFVAASLFSGVPAGGNTPDDPETPARFHDGVTAARASRPTAVLITIFAAALFSFGITLVLFVLVAVRRLGMDESGVGYLRMAEGIGGVTAAIFAGRLASRNSAPVLMAAALLSAAAPIAIALTTRPVVALVVLALGSAAYVVFEVIVMTWLQRVTPDHMLGRIMGLIMSLGAIGTAAGAMVAPAIERLIGLQWALVFSGAIIIIAVVAVAPALPTIASAARIRTAELDPIVDVLRSLELFTGADDLALERLAGAVTEINLPIGSVVIREGDAPDNIYIVRNGILDVRAVGEIGRTGAPEFVNAMGAGDWFGEIGLIERTERTATVTTTTATTLWQIPGDVFLSTFENVSLRPDIVRTGIAIRLARTHPSRTTFAP